MAKYLPILSLLFLFISCSVLIKKSYTDYTSSNFECWEGIGYRSSEKFEQYRNLWHKMRSIYREENQKIKTASAVFVGNSLIQLFPNEILTKEFPGAVNRGIGGDMTETLLERLEEDVISLNPKAIVLEIGGNDLIQGKCLYLIENNLVKILDKLTRSLPETKIIILGIPPVRARSLNNISPVVNLAWISIIQSYKNVIFLDNWQWFREKDRSVLRQEFWLERDEIHLNENAYKVWVEKLKTDPFTLSLKGFPLLLILTQKPYEIRKELLLGIGNFVSLKSEETFLLSSASVRTRGEWSCIEWKISRNLDLQELIELRAMFAKRNSDLLQIDYLLDPKKKSFFVFDMDSTLIQQEVIDELARLTGVYEEVASVTKEAMEGNLDFHEALKKRCVHLKGLSSSIFTELYPKLKLNAGVESLLRSLKEKNSKTAVFSGGFIDILEMFQKQYGIDEIHANVLERQNGQFSGNVVGDIVDKNKKFEYLKMIRDREGISRSQVVAVGDGANDALMLNEAGIGIGFHAKEGLKKLIVNWVDFAPLDVLLFLFS